MSQDITKINKNQKWNTTNFVTTPPTEGAFLTARGWELPIAGSAAGQSEVLVALSSNYVTVNPASVYDIATGLVSKYYILGDVLSFDVVFNEAVDVTGSPTISIQVGPNARTATYASGTGTNSLTFNYTVQSTDVDLDGVSINNNITLAGGTIKDKGTATNATLTFTGSAFTSKFTGIQVDAIARTISSVTGPGTNKVTGQVVAVTVNFNYAVKVTGSPQIPLYKNDGTTLVGQLVYASGSGTAALVFNYTVQAGDVVTVAAKAGANISLNGGTIKNMNGDANATVTFVQTTLTGTTIN